MLEVLKRRRRRRKRPKNVKQNLFINIFLNLPLRKFRDKQKQNCFIKPNCINFERKFQFARK